MQKTSRNSAMNKWQCRIAPSLGAGFAGTPESAWGTHDYYEHPFRLPQIPYTDIHFEGNLHDPTVFFGLYGFPDFYTLWRHKGRRVILWVGSDITHFVNGYWLDDKGEIKFDPNAMAKWINNSCESYVENEVEQEVLREVGIDSIVAPSFLGNIDDYEVSFEPNKKYYTSVSGDEFKLYGWGDTLSNMAFEHPEVEFHCYGNDISFTFRDANLELVQNIFVHGRVSQEQMNEETKKMQGAIRLTEFDGFAEILAKSILWGQHPVSPYIKYPHIDTEIKEHTEPNLEGRDYYRENLNQYPWNSNL